MIFKIQTKFLLFFDSFFKLQIFLQTIFLFQNGFILKVYGLTTEQVSSQIITTSPILTTTNSSGNESESIGISPSVSVKETSMFPSDKISPSPVFNDSSDIFTLNSTQNLHAIEPSSSLSPSSLSIADIMSTSIIDSSFSLDYSNSVDISESVVLNSTRRDQIAFLSAVTSNSSVTVETESSVTPGLVLSGSDSPGWETSNSSAMVEMLSSVTPGLVLSGSDSPGLGATSFEMSSASVIEDIISSTLIPEFSASQIKGTTVIEIVDPSQSLIDPFPTSMSMEISPTPRETTMSSTISLNETSERPEDLLTSTPPNRKEGEDLGTDSITSENPDNITNIESSIIYLTTPISTTKNNLTNKAKMSQSSKIAAGICIPLAIIVFLGVASYFYRRMRPARCAKFPEAGSTWCYANASFTDDAIKSSAQKN